jgi:predicted nucleic acid-binding protein
MTKPRVYIETTIPSFYHEVRTTPDIVARREWTRQWWSDAPERYQLVTSPAVLDELAGGAPERGTRWLALIRDLPLLPVESAITEIVQVYIRHKLMPTDPAGDALHLALASYHDPARLVTYYIELQEQYRDRAIEASETTGHVDQSAAYSIY